MLRGALLTVPCLSEGDEVREGGCRADEERVSAAGGEGAVLRLSEGEEVREGGWRAEEDRLRTAGGGAEPRLSEGEELRAADKGRAAVGLLLGLLLKED